MIALYRPGSSFLHRAHAAAKTVGLVLTALGISLAPRTLLVAAIALALVVIGYIAAGFGPRVLLGQLWLARWVVVVMVATQVLFVPPVETAASTAKVLALVLVAALLTLTTRSEDLLAALERALAPLRRIRIDPARIALVLSLTIALIPVIASFARRIREAQRARGVRLGYRAVVPLLVLSLRHADQVADALSARGVE